MADTNTSLPASAPPDLSGLLGAGSAAQPISPSDASTASAPMAAPNQPAAPGEAMTPGMSAPDVTDRSINPAQPPTPPAGAAINPSAPHARLMAMVNGLAEGLGAFGKSIATKGKEGGVDEVIQERGEQQHQKEEALASAQAQKNADIQNKIATATLNHLNTTNIILNAQAPDEIALSHMSVPAAQTKLAGEEFNLFAGTGMNPQQIQALTNGGQVDTKTSGMLQANAQQQYRIASQLLPSDNPVLGALKNAINNPGTSPATLVQLNNRLQSELKGQEGVNDAKIKQAAAAAAAPFGDKSDMVNDAILRRMQVNHPEVKSLPEGYAMTPTSTPKDLDRVDKLLLPTETAEATKANREIANGMREQMLDLAKGSKIPGDETKDGAEYISSLPVGVAGTIKAIHEGREAPPPAGSRSAAAQTILGALNHAYPDYDATKYPAYLKARTAFTGGPEAKGINALNTVEGHLSRMLNHANAAFTSGGVTGRLTGFFGDKDVQALNVDRTAVSTELSKAYAANQITEGEIKDWESKLDITRPGMTTGKLVNYIKEIDALLESKQKAYQTQWETAAPAASIVSPVPIISSDAAAARANIRGEAAPAPVVASAPTAPTGADNEVWVSGKLVGHTVGNKYVPLGQ